MKVIVAERALSAARAEVDRVVTTYADWPGPIATWIRRLNAAEVVVVWLEAGGMPRRPDRRMPTCSRIARFHGRPADACWRCEAPGYVERAHMIDRVFDGLDGVQNLALLCPRCHEAMGCNESGDEEYARAHVGLPPLDLDVSDVGSSLAGEARRRA